MHGFVYSSVFCTLLINWTLKNGKIAAKTNKALKKNIQKGFRQQLGLLVDQPKQEYGNTNDGNTARRFFENSMISASITGVDETLIHVILQVITCGFEIDVPKYEEYC